MRGFHRDRRRDGENAGQDPGFVWQEVEDEAAQPSWQDTVDEWLPPEETDPEPQDEAYDEPYGDGAEARFDDPEPASREIVATNRTIRLSCSLAAACGPFALFLLFVEHESRAIRHFSAQSVGLSALHLLSALIMGALGAATAAAPVVGTALNVFCWMAYLCAALTCLILRIRLMAAAWRGFAFRLPLIGKWTERMS